jgi:hypothetical protein
VVEKPAAPPKPTLPVNAAQYIEYLRVWVERATDDAAIHDRWADERDLRAKCGVAYEDMDTCRDIKDARVRAITGEDR